MSQSRSFHLSLGSNIRSELNLAEAVRRLRAYGDVGRISSAWQSHAVGSDGPDFLNIALEFAAQVSAQDLKERVIATIETELGRIRSEDKNAPRTIDIDILLEGQEVHNRDLWAHAYVTVPMSELLPAFLHPTTGRQLAAEATRAKASTWIRRRPVALHEYEDGART